MIDNKTIRKVIMLNKMLPSGSPTYENREASGAVANFTTNTVQPFVKCECEILPIQEGTGTPSPSNPRPISGTDKLMLTHTSYRTAETYTFDLGQEIMGGTADVVGGVGSKTKAYYDFTNKNTPWESGAPNEAGFIRFVRTIADKAKGYYLLCDKFPTKIGIIPSSPTEEAISGYASNNSIYIAVSTSRLSGDLTTSAGRRQAFNDWIDANGLEICYELATPTPFTFTGQPIRSFLGVNNVWTKAGDTKVTYKYKTGEGGSSTKKYLPIFYDLYEEGCRHL